MGVGIGIGIGCGRGIKVEVKLKTKAAHLFEGDWLSKAGSSCKIDHISDLTLAALFFFLPVFQRGMGEEIGFRHATKWVSRSMELFLFLFPSSLPNQWSITKKKKKQNKTTTCASKWEQEQSEKERSGREKTTFHGDTLLCYVLFCYFCRRFCCCCFCCSNNANTTNNNNNNNNDDATPIIESGTGISPLYQCQRARHGDDFISALVLAWPALIAKHLPRPTSNGQQQQQQRKKIKKRARKNVG